MGEQWSLPTPALILDRERMRANIARAKARAAALGVALRPHLKTCKSVAIAKEMIDPATPMAAVSTLAETKAFFHAGIANLRYTSPFAADKVDVVAPWIKNGLHFEILVDDPDAARAMAERAEAAGVTITAIIEIDVDGVRGGVQPHAPRIDEVVSVLRERDGLHCGGVYSYAGATYDLFSRDERADRVETHRAALVATAARLDHSGLTCASIGMGSSPALADARSLDGLTEHCAGVFVFQDLAQCGIGVATLADIAVSVLATVTAQKPDAGRVFIDAGGLALSHDRSTAGQSLDQGYGLVCDVTTGQPLGDGDLIVSAVSQEHGRITKRDGSPPPFDALPVGRRVRILPNHVCMTAAAYEAYAALDDDDGSDALWPRINGWTG